ncbi:hypothetical protein KCP78_08265 [Salmonella enterica subsp. enterica]|nr:hypothetical protein KCP78_08265 [Salmonella enterica subsp. enterica]
MAIFLKTDGRKNCNAAVGMESIAPCWYLRVRSGNGTVNPARSVHFTSPRGRRLKTHQQAITPGQTMQLRKMIKRITTSFSF